MTAKIETYSRYTKSGEEKKDKDLILEVIRTEPGLHRIEISSRTGIKESTVTARVDFLRRKGLVYVSGTRLHGGKPQSVYTAIKDLEMRNIQRMRISARKFYDRLKTLLRHDASHMHVETHMRLIQERNRIEPRIIYLDSQFNTLTQKNAQP